jgi:hypothetical protein
MRREEAGDEPEDAPMDRATTSNLYLRKDLPADGDSADD